MTGDNNLEPRLEAWLEANARPMPPDLLEDALATIPRGRPAGVHARFPSGRRWQLVGGAAAALIIVVGVGAALRLPPGPGTDATPTIPSATPLAPDATEAPPTPPASAGTSGSPSLGEWHRNNYNAGEEVLTCRESTQSWTCYYQVADGSGRFSGLNMTSGWACPAWFPSAICEHVVAVYEGRFQVFGPEGETSPPSDPIAQNYILTRVEGETILQLYWVNQHVCPWYRTGEAALAAPYECVIAP